MIRAGVGISSSLDPETAGARAAEEALEEAGLRGAACGLVLATAAHGGALEHAVKAAAERLGTDTVVGGAVEGVLAGCRGVEGNPGVAVLALENAGRAGGAVGFLLRDLFGAEEQAGEEILARVGGPARAEDLLLLFPDSLALLAQPLLASIHDALSPAKVVGLGASPIPGAAPLVWGEGEVAEAALAGLYLRGAGPAWAGVSNGCCPASGELRVTRARGNWVLGVDGRPALDVYREVAGDVDDAVLARASRQLMAALAVEARPGAAAGGHEGCEGFLARGAFVVRDIVGIDPGRRAFSLPEAMTSGRSLAFVRRDRAQGEAELAALLSRAPWGDASLALHFRSRTRGATLREGAEGGGSAGWPSAPAYPEGRPLIGGTGAYQIGPVSRRSGAPACELLTHSDVLALLVG